MSESEESVNIDFDIHIHEHLVTGRYYAIITEGGERVWVSAPQKTLLEAKEAALTFLRILSEQEPEMLEETYFDAVTEEEE